MGAPYRREGLELLITSCAHCQARFRVTPQQLNARQGHVRCGRCNKIFNGFQSLERFPDDDTGGRLLAAQEARERESALKDAARGSALPASGEARPPDESAMPALETLEPTHPDPTTTPLDAPVPAAPAAPSAPSPATAPARLTRIHDEPQLSLEVPPRKRPSRAWSFGVVLMVMVLLAEAAFAFRGTVAQRYPLLRPALEMACTPFKCSVPWAREDGLLKLEESEMLEVPGKTGEIALGARIRNLASVAQEYPHLELTLTDNSGQPAVRRVLRPTDYLGHPVAAGEVIAPGVEIALQMRLHTERIKATGYELLLFYP